MFTHRWSVAEVRWDLAGIGHDVGAAEGFVRAALDQERDEIADLGPGEMLVSIRRAWLACSRVVRLHSEP